MRPTCDATTQLSLLSPRGPGGSDLPMDELPNTGNLSQEYLGSRAIPLSSFSLLSPWSYGELLLPPVHMNLKYRSRQFEKTYKKCLPELLHVVMISHISKVLGG